MQEADLETAEKGEKGQKAVEPVGETDSSTLSQTSDQVGEKYVDPNELSKLFIPRPIERNDVDGIEPPLVRATNKDGKMRDYYVDMDMEVGEHNINGNETYPPLEMLYDEYGEKFLKEHNIDPAVLPAPGKYRLLGYNNLGFYIDFNGGEYFIPGFGVPGHVRQMIEQGNYRGLMADAIKVESAQKAEAPGQSGVPVNEEVGPFGRIYRQFKGKAKEAIQFLLGKKEGEVVGALNHPEIGDIDLVWGEEGTSNSDGYGLAKLAKYHPEVLDNLQEIINDMRVTKRSANRVQLESDTHQAAVRLTWDNKSKNWLLTAFEKKNSVSDNTTDTGETSDGGKQNDTATLQNTVSTDEGTTQSAKVQENSQKSGEDELDVYLAEMKAAQERQKAFAQKSPRPSSFVEAYTANDAEVIKRLDKQFNDALQTLVPLDIPAIEATIRGMKDRKSINKANSANDAYKALDHIEKALAKRKKQLEKELTEDDKRRIDIIKRGNRGELKETTLPKQEKASQGERSKGKTESESKPEVEKIEDVGEKIGGAKKDRFAEGMARIKAEVYLIFQRYKSKSKSQLPHGNIAKMVGVF